MSIISFWRFHFATCCLFCPQFLWAIPASFPTAFSVGRGDRQCRYFSIEPVRLHSEVFYRSGIWDFGEGPDYWLDAEKVSDYTEEWWRWTGIPEPNPVDEAGNVHRIQDGDGYSCTFSDSDGNFIGKNNHHNGVFLDGTKYPRRHGACFVLTLTNSAALPRDRRAQRREEIITPAKETLAILNFPLVTDGTNNFLYDLRTHRKWKTALSAEDVSPARGLQGAVCVRKGGKWGLSGYDGTEILPCVYDGAKAVEPLGFLDIDAYVLQKDGKTGVCRDDGSWIVPPGEYKSFEPFAVSFIPSEWFLRGTAKDGGVGVVKCEDGAWVIPPKYEDVLRPGVTGALCRKNGLWGVVSFSGEPLTQFAFASAEDDYRHRGLPVGIWRATLPDGSKRKVTEQGTVCGEEASFLMAGDALLCIDGRRVFDIADPENGVRLVEGASAGFLGISPSNTVLIGTDKNGRGGRGSLPFGDYMGGCYGVYDYTHRREVAPPMYGEISVNENMVVAHNAERTDIYSLDGEHLLSLSSRAQLPENYHGGFYEIPFKTNFTFIAGIGPVLDGNRAGLIDTNGVLRLPMEYEDMGAYHEGVAPAKRDGLWGYVDLAGNWAIPPKYEAADAFVNGHAAVRLEGRVGIVTRADEVAAPFVYEEAGYVYRGMFPAKVGGKWGVFGLDGETKLPPEYACIEWIDIRDPRVPTRFHGHLDWAWE